MCCVLISNFKRLMALPKLDGDKGDSHTKLKSPMAFEKVLRDILFWCFISQSLLSNPTWIRYKKTLGITEDFTVTGVKTVLSPTISNYNVVNVLIHFSQYCCGKTRHDPHNYDKSTLYIQYLITHSNILYSCYF